MRPLFTIHAGEFLVGEYISRKLKRDFDVWLPVQDTGVDLLVTPRSRHRRNANKRQPPHRDGRSYPTSAGAVVFHLTQLEEESHRALFDERPLLARTTARLVNSRPSASG